MERKGHYLQPGTRATAPNVVFALVPSPAHIPSGRGSDSDWLTWGGADVCVARYRRGKWSDIRGARCETPEALWQWMEAHAERGARNYVVSPNAAEALAICRHWDHLSTAPVKWSPKSYGVSAKMRARVPAATTWVRRCCLTQRCVILDYQRGPLRWVWLSGRQHFDMPENALARTIGEPWRDTGRYDDDDTGTTHTPQARAVLWLRAYEELADWWRRTAKAPFGLTAASMSLGVLRTHVPKKLLCTHRVDYVHQLERDACFGGRASVWYYGDVGDPRRCCRPGFPAPAPSKYGRISGPIVKLDVRSMYPFLLREHRFPVSLYKYRERMSQSELLQQSRHYGVIARVTVETEVPEYPLRTKAGIIYPVGRFTTTLTGPELLRIAQEGTIAAVHAVAVYDMARPFKDAAGALIAMREECRANGQEGWELFAKMIANALGGKLAQRRGEWIERPDVSAKVQFGEWSERRSKREGYQRYRAIAGLVWKYEKDRTGSGPFTAAFAYLTAYGRLHMREIRDALPRRSVLQMDTDGIWVVARHASAVQFSRAPESARAGDLCIRDRSTSARFFGPKHYRTDREWVLAGFSSPVVARSGREIRDVRRHTPIAGPMGAAPRGTSVEQRASALAVESDGSVIGPDGWALPRRCRGSAD